MGNTYSFYIAHRGPTVSIVSSAKLSTPHALETTTLSHSGSSLQPQPGLHRKQLSNADNLDNRHYFSLILVYIVWQKRQWTMDTVGPRCAI